MNFIEEYKKGQTGGNKGLPMGIGLSNINNAISGVQKGRIYGIAAAPKTGKSTFTDYAFVLQPFLYAVKHNVPIEWIYFSFEIDRVSKEFDFASFFLYHDFKIKKIVLPKGVRRKGKSTIELSSNYLRGRVQDDNGNIIKVNSTVFDHLKKVYEKRIIPLFGEYDDKGMQIKKGYITFIEDKDNPTGLKKYLTSHAEKEGCFIRDGNEYNKRITNYKPDNPEKHTIIITDHLRKLKPERGFLMKQTVDKYIEYSVELRNFCGYTFVHIIHLNRNMADIHRQKQFGDQLFPSSDDIKDTGLENSNFLLIFAIII